MIELKVEHIRKVPNPNRKRGELLHYLKLLEKKGVDPNFWISLPYLETIGAVVLVENYWWWIEEDGKPLFPAVSEKGVSPTSESYPLPEGWADFSNLKFPIEGTYTFLDYEYIYTPSDFSNMSGKKWGIFRKNIRKWPRRNGEYQYSKEFPGTKEIEKLMIAWLEKDPTARIQDEEVLLKYIFEPPLGVTQKFLISKRKLIGMNIWDENYKYINYRVSVCLPREPFLNEFCRLLFYRDSIVLRSGKLVNDGGVLDRTGLERFKDKMNPIRKRKVYSWKKRK